VQAWATKHITNYLLEINFRKEKAIKNYTENVSTKHWASWENILR
jgi:hypothetical protein